VRFVVAPLVDFPPDTRRIVRVGGREIGVFRVDGKFYAVRNRCPHQGAPLCTGHVGARVDSPRPGEVTTVAGSLLMCPWHGWSYDMATGQAYAPGDPNVRAYGVSIERGDALEGTAAEVFDVHVEDDYVVLEA
jgi:3-phenylpropionate/trans-cinnamate dioxygenase ferredoxin subunit